MFERRRREEAEGERRMMGSGRRWEDGLPGLMRGFPGRETRGVLAAAVRDLEGRDRERNVSAILRT